MRADQSHAAAVRLAAGALRRSAREALAELQAAWPAIQRFVSVRLLYKQLRPELIEDCAQNVFLRVWLFRRGYRGTEEREFWTWLRQICDNERRRILAREARRLRGGPGAADPAADVRAETASAAEPPALDSESLRALQECLAGLSAARARVVELVYFGPELTERAAAAALGCSAAYVHRLKREALKLLAECLSAKGIE